MFKMGEKEGRAGERGRIGEWAGNSPALHHRATEMTVNPECTNKIESNIQLRKLQYIFLKSVLWSFRWLQSRTDVLFFINNLN